MSQIYYFFEEVVLEGLFFNVFSAKMQQKTTIHQFYVTFLI